LARQGAPCEMLGDGGYGKRTATRKAALRGAPDCS
jgi:hypothetical protein